MREATIDLNECPLKLKECYDCKFAKEGLCDYPYVGAIKKPLSP